MHHKEGELRVLLKFHSIVKGLANGNSTLRVLRLSNFEWDEMFSQVFTIALGNPCSALVVLRLGPRNLTDETWKQALSDLQSNRSLQEFRISARNGTLSGASLVATMESIATNPDSGLQILELSSFCTGAPTAYGYIAAVHRLSTNSALHELHVFAG
jgi:hypothetical protein